MNFLLKNNFLDKSFYLLFLLIFSSGLSAQNRQLVWADEFERSSINRSVWDFERGPSNDNVHYYTDRSDNTQIVDGKLNIIALRESYEGFSYTSAQITTKQTLNWKYGRVEASSAPIVFRPRLSFSRISKSPSLAIISKLDFTMSITG